MPTLRITVDWLDGVYHGVEWPPSPLRLYQAMIAGYSVNQRGNPVLRAAMQHLDTLPAPTIIAPLAWKRSPVMTSVPNNDGDIVLESYASGNVSKARKEASTLTTTRTRYSRSVEGPVTYDWQANDQTVEHFSTLQGIVASVSAVGQGIDLAVARAKLLESPPPVAGIRHTPALQGRRKLKVPYRGLFDVLEKRYQRFRQSIGTHGVSGIPEPSHRQSAYVSEADLPALHSEAFFLRSPGDKPLSFEGTRAMEVAAMTRHAIGDAARGAGLSGEVISELMGHGGERRIRVQPLPNVGYQHADGRIRRVLLTAPESVEEDHWLDVLFRLVGADLIPEGQGEAIGSLTPIGGEDRILQRYYAESRTWTSATPVVLPGHDHRRGRARPERTARRLLRHAGIPEALVENITLEPAARLRGSGMPSQYQRPKHLERFPCQHMTIRWRCPVTGPVFLGAGTGYGLGLFLPAR